MKENRFIELINLYVDRQISPAETAELEAEIQTSPRHRKIYQQYCHMHRATKLVYETFRANAEQPVGTGSKTGGSVAQFEHSRNRTQRARWLYSAAGLAAAACFAIVLVGTGSISRTDNSAETANARPGASGLVASAVTAEQSAAALQKEAEATLVAQQYAALLSLKRQEEMRAYAISQQIAAQPIKLFADNVFDEKQIMSPESLKVLQLKRKTESTPTTEFTAFQFQR